jgi:hypothetical protein
MDVINYFFIFLRNAFGLSKPKSETLLQAQTFKGIQWLE